MGFQPSSHVNPIPFQVYCANSWCRSQRGLLCISLSFSPSIQIFLSLSLSLTTPPPLLPCFQGREGELLLPEADCSSLNNSCRLPAVLSPVLHHSITPLHKDIQMGWDAHSHKTLTDTLKQACAHLHVNLHTFTMHIVKKYLSAHTLVNWFTQTHTPQSTRKGCSEVSYSRRLTNGKED